MKKFDYLFKFIVFIGILALCWFVSTTIDVDIDYYRQLLLKFPLYISGLIFVLLYIGLTSVLWFGPKDILRIVAAVLFGPYVSTVLVWLGELGNAIIFFHISRVFGKDFVDKKFRIKERDVQSMQKNTNIIGIIALRMNPIISFRLMDLGYGLSRVDFKKYFYIIFIISPIRILWIQYVIAAIGENVLKEPRLMIDYLQSHLGFLKISAVYFFVVAVLSILAIFLRPKVKKTEH